VTLANARDKLVKEESLLALLRIKERGVSQVTSLANGRRNLSRKVLGKESVVRSTTRRYLATRHLLKRLSEDPLLPMLFALDPRDKNSQKWTRKLVQKALDHQHREIRLLAARAWVHEFHQPLTEPQTDRLTRDLALVWNEFSPDAPPLPKVLDPFHLTETLLASYGNDLLNTLGMVAFSNSLSPEQGIHLLELVSAKIVSNAMEAKDSDPAALSKTLTVFEKMLARVLKDSDPARLLQALQCADLVGKFTTIGADKSLQPSLVAVLHQATPHLETVLKQLPKNLPDDASKTETAKALRLLLIRFRAKSR
jgi:DNA-binding phage protein